MTTNTPQQSSSDNVAWGPAGSKTQANNSISSPNQLSGSPTSSQSNNGPSNTTKQQLEQLQNLREAIFSQDGWGVVSYEYYFYAKLDLILQIVITLHNFHMPVNFSNL